MAKLLPPLLRRLRADARGASAIEFAMIAPALFAVLVATIETSLVYLAQDGLETAAETGSRLLLTGQAQSGLTASQFRTAACSALPPYMTCANLMVDVRVAGSFSAADTGMPTLTYDSGGNVTNAFSYATGAQGSIVVLRLLYLWPTNAGPLGFALANQPGNKRLLVATSVLRTESY
ncbi:TadE/TadG family type IV pilus assembly protein [Novosphingobium colocasiae]|uniref:Pilus assembly protein TadG n=1 Tax=Novosphingobium colocasiae TaxID=1256513 RepID=A0A918UHF1_9SPHN|nr:TadE/TadG family type IV pilus assembly protein [Novosphingobium colocasiae]GGZ08324.1 pilus assembly protein TadG [Novosphingobium colocasiae]